MIRATAVSIALCVATACAKSGSGATEAAGTTAQPAQASTRRSANLITAEELEKSPARDAHHAVQMLRPDWLRSRGTTSMRTTASNEAVVYLNGQRFGGVRALEQFQPSAIKEMRYLTGSEATNRFGTGHNGGAILLLTK